MCWAFPEKPNLLEEGGPGSWEQRACVNLNGFEGWYAGPQTTNASADVFFRFSSLSLKDKTGGGILSKIFACRENTFQNAMHFHLVSITEELRSCSTLQDETLKDSRQQN